MQEQSPFFSKREAASAVKKKDGMVVCGLFQILFTCKYHSKFNLFLFIFPCAVFVYERDSKNVA